MKTTTPSRIDPAVLRERLTQPDTVSVLDVRSPAEFDTVHIPGSINVPLNLLDQHAETLATRLVRPQVVLVCQSGTRAAHAQRHLAGVGVDNAHVLTGGISASTPNRLSRWRGTPNAGLLPPRRLRPVPTV